MKRNFTKKFLTVLLCFMTVLGILFFVGCKPTVEPSDPTGPENSGTENGDNTGSGGSEGAGGTPPPVENKLFLFDQEMNPEYSSRTEALDTIFNPDELGELVLVFDRSEWNKHLDYCDYSLQHEDSVVAKGFYFKKDNKEWFFKDIGFRIRGNTSRLRPQEKKSDGTNGKYVQAHFALDFEEWTDEDKKLADSMKGLILKRANNDSTYVREVYGYNLFRKNKIWISPRAAFTTLKIQIVDDLDLDKDGDKTEFETVNYGVYGMIEEIKKQFLKERTIGEGGGEFSNNKGNLWKCLWKNNGSDFVFANASSIGEEEVFFEFDEDGNITDFNNITYDYDYKGDNDLEKDGKPQILAFMEELNNLPNCTDGNNDEADIQTIRTFYTNRMDGDLFLRTYAINVILGMWDDYWVNKNNFYFYFDKDTQKAYFIPYDYDNILGTNGCNTDAGTKNPLNWGSLTNGERPLIQKILQVPEYMEAYKEYLIEYSNEDSYFDDDKSIAQITKWHNMFKDYIASDDLAYYSKLEDKPASWGTPYVPYTVYTPGKMNYFTVRQKAIKACVNPSDEKLTLTLNAGEGTFASGEDTYNYEFTAGTTLEEILEANDFDAWSFNYDDSKYISYSYINDGVYYYPWCFIDSEGREIYKNNFNQITLYEDTTLNTLYKKWVPITFDGNVIMNESGVMYLLEDSDLPSMDLPETDEYLCIGWTLDPYGEDFVTKVPSEPVILYAKWIAKDELVLPYEFSEDLSKITFIFRPNDYNVSLSSTVNYDVYLMSSFTLPDGWPESACSDHNRLIKDSEGNYRITIDSTDVYYNWPGFQFCVNGQWCGPKNYNQFLTNESIIGDSKDNFAVLFPEEPTISFDLNGGTSTSYLEESYPTNNLVGASINGCYQWNLGLSLPENDDLVFAGWTLTKDGDDYVDRIPFGKITVYAKYIESQELKLTLISDENSWFKKYDEESEEYVQYDEELVLPFITGQTFSEILGSVQVLTSDSIDGYYRYEYFYSNNDSVDWETPLIENTTVYVKTTFIPYISITLDANGGTFGDGSDTLNCQIPENDGINKAPPTKDGCIFIGWYNKVGERVEWASSKNTLLYAQYLDVFTENTNIIGDFALGGDPLIKIDDNTYSYTFEYSANMSGSWGTSVGQVAFKLRTNKNWDDPNFGGFDFIMVDDNRDYWCYQDCSDIVVSGLEDGVSYTITFKTESNNVLVNIATAE